MIQRYTAQQQQELISRQQIAERFSEYGWIPTRPEVDLGEDFLIHIYNNGAATGVIFHVQAKSVTNLPIPNRSGNLSYRFETKDLLHWETFHVPVVLIIWDIVKRNGCWALAKDVIGYLEVERKGWRNNKTKTTVQIPIDNRLDDPGFGRLRSLIGRHFLPIIAANRNLDMAVTFAVPDTSEGQEIRRAFERHTKEGEPVTLTGRVIQEIEFSDWWQPWQNGFDPDKAVIELGPIQSTNAVLATIDVVSSNGDRASVPNLELKCIRAGSELVKLTNQHQQAALEIHIEIRRTTDRIAVSMSISIRNLGRSAFHALEILRFLAAVSAGGKMRVFYGNDLAEPLAFTSAAQPLAVPDQRLVDLVEKLCVIESRTGLSFRVPHDGIGKADRDAINEVFEVVTRGQTHIAHAIVTWSLGAVILPDLLEAARKHEPVTFRSTSDVSYIDVFGTRVQLGPVTKLITGIVDAPSSSDDCRMTEMGTDLFVGVRLIDSVIIETFSQWTTSQLIDLAG